MSYRSLFPSLPDEARAWIYLADRPLNDDEQASLELALNTFLKSWTSHGRPIQAAAEVVDARMLIVAGNIPGGDISGCGIDASVRFIEEAATRLGLSWAPALYVTYRDEEGHLQPVSRSTFRALAERGLVNTDTPVLDTSVTTLGHIREGRLETPAGTNWTARMLHVRNPVATAE